MKLPRFFCLAIACLRCSAQADRAAAINPVVSRASGLLLLALFGLPAWAHEASITAEYRGATSGRFTNTTPQAGFCGRWTSECNGVQTVGLPITYTKRVIKGDPNVREHYFVQLPGPREVDVFHEKNGESHRLKLEFTAFSQRVESNVPLTENPVWTVWIRGGCSYRKSYGWNPSGSIYLWGLKNPKVPGACHSVGDKAQVGVPSYSRTWEMGIAYNLDMPSPYRMKPGIYTGSLTYSIGPGGDFDFGEGVTELSGNSVTLNFRLDVQHAFMFDFPPGSERAVLVPPGGWQSWLGGRGAPPRLERDLPFRLWSTGPFKVYKLCQQNLGNGCAISNAGNHAVPVSVGLSLPGGIQHQGRPVQRLELPTGRSEALAFEALTPSINRPGQLHFTVGPQDTKAMLDHPGSRYEGLVTVVFDSEL